MSFTANMAMAAMTARNKINEIGSSPMETDPETGETIIKGNGTDKWVTLAKYGIVQIVAICGLCSGLVTFFLIAGQVYDLASILLIIAAPVVMYQKFKLKSLGEFRGQHNHLRNSINLFHMENDKLTTSVNELSDQVTNLKKVEDELEKIASESGAQVNRLVSVVHENGELIKQIKKGLQAEILQQIITAVLTSDRDHDFTIGPTEVKILTMRLKNITGVLFDEEKFHTFLESDEGELTLKDMMNVVHNMENSTPEDAIFSYKPKDLL